jgi:hypothetical protein
MRRLKMNKLTLVLFSSFMYVLAGCGSEPDKSETILETVPVPLAEQLIGEWKNSSLNLKIHNDTDSTVIIDSENWVEVLGIQPIVSEFKNDSSYLSRYYSPEGEEIMTSTGIWYIRGDSLIMIERQIPNAYHLRMEGNSAYFRGYIDWDQDGVADDLYEGIQVRQ